MRGICGVCCFQISEHLGGGTVIQGGCFMGLLKEIRYFIFLSFIVSEDDDEDDDSDITLQEMSLDSALELDHGDKDKRETAKDHQQRGSFS